MTPEEQAALAPLATAFTALGYPEFGVWDAAQRIAWATPLVPDFMTYAERYRVAAGPPGPGADTARPLPGGYTVDALLRDYGFEPSGAFLMAAALITHTAEAYEALERMIVDGVARLEPDGSTSMVEVPIAARYPACPACAARIVRSAPACPRCGWDLAAPVEPDPAAWDDGPGGAAAAPSPPAAEPSAADMPAGEPSVAAADLPAAFCTKCGKSLAPDAAFCTGCGRPIG